MFIQRRKIVAKDTSGTTKLNILGLVYKLYTSYKLSAVRGLFRAYYVLFLVIEFHILGYLLLYFASCVNPIIYVIMNKQYRQAYAGVIGCSRIRASLSPYGSSAPGHHQQQDYGQGNFEHRRVVTLTKL